MQEHSAVCMRHSLQVLSVISLLMTLIGSLFGSTKWYCWLTISATLITTPLAITSAVLLKRRLLVVYIIADFFEIAIKIFFIVKYTFVKLALKEECSRLRSVDIDESCDEWRYTVLNIKNAIIFMGFASALDVMLLVFGFQLFTYLGQVWVPSLQFQFSTTSNPSPTSSTRSEYGTFRRTRMTIERFVSSL